MRTNHHQAVIASRRAHHISRPEPPVIVVAEDPVPVAEPPLAPEAPKVEEVKEPEAPKMAETDAPKADSEEPATKAAKAKKPTNRRGKKNQPQA
jgi:hypothetical protein